MGAYFQELLEELFLKGKPVNGAKTFYTLGHFFGRIAPDYFTIAEVGIGYNPVHLDNLKNGFDHETNSEKEIRLIGIDPKYIPPSHIEYKKGKIQDLSLNLGEVNVLVYYDLLGYISSGSVTRAQILRKMDEQILEVSPDYVIFSDPDIYLKLQEMSGKRNDHEYIYSGLSSEYTEIGLQKYVGKTFKSYRWMFFVRNDIYNSIEADLVKI